MDAVEVKAVKDAVQALGTTFEQFKAANDAAMAEIKKSGAVSADTATKLVKIEEDLTKLDEIRNRMDDIEAKAQKAGGFGGATEQEQLQTEYKQAFDGFIRKGIGDGSPELYDLERRSLNITTPAEGGHAVPEELDRAIHDLMVDISPMRSLANVVQVGSSDYKKLVNLRGAASGWVGETTARPETAAPQFAEIAPPIGEIYANLYATQHMLDDAFFNVDQFILDNLAIEFEAQEGAAFITGNGVNKPKGFLDEATAATADGVRAFGTLQYVPTGVAGGFAAAPDGGDALLDLIYSLKRGHRMGASFVMSKGTLAETRKLKNTDGSYLWRPGLEMGQPSTLLGYGITEMEDMPEIAADALAIAFGNWKAGYTIVDRIGTRFLRDPYSAKPYVTFYVTKRVGGKIIDSEAIKLLKFSVA